MTKQQFGNKGLVSKAEDTSDTSIGNSYDLTTDNVKYLEGKVKHGSGNTLDSEKSRKSVRFRDGRKGDDEEVNIDSNGDLGKGLVDVAYFATLMNKQEPWVDRNFLAGFRDIFSAGEVWVQEVQCIPCGLDTSFKISTRDDKTPLFYARKSQRAFPTWFKSLFCSYFSCFRNGFKVKIFNLTGTQLVTFVRKTHICASQLDIVETYYGKEEMYVGRVERSAHGYVLKDKFQDDVYRVMRIPKNRNSLKKMSRMSLELSKGLVPTENPKEGWMFFFWKSGDENL
ncbi:uncharacterized protein LOC118435330 isoform X2 [Folsomia candida]|uniref:uncharacterized protein LOC118435330 isoform X2 n=1 Tax=Folsomia candida TaxID=158441 RepID=UPI001604B046|nr:uncharacterized protein LOC118435330 isoform X2 [Folsomia candida]